MQHEEVADGSARDAVGPSAQTCVCLLACLVESPLVCDESVLMLCEEGAQATNVDIVWRRGTLRPY